MADPDSDYAYGLCEEIIGEVAPRPDQEGLAGLARVFLHWLIRQEPALFARPQAGGVSPSLRRQIVVNRVYGSLPHTTVHCSNCDKILLDSSPENPLECDVCGGREVEARDLILGQIAHMANRGIKLD